MSTTELSLQYVESLAVVDAPEQHTAMIHLVVSRAEMQRAMVSALGELGGALREQGVEPTGPWFAHHLRRPTDTFDFEASFPVAAPITPQGRVTNGLVKAGRAAHATYRGGYEGLPQAWGEFMAWIEGQGHAPGGDFWEVYRVNPADTPESARWVTELYCRLTS